MPRTPTGHSFPVQRYDHTEAVRLAEVPCIWYGSFGNIPGRLVLVKDDDCVKTYDLALFTTDEAAAAGATVKSGNEDRWHLGSFFELRYRRV